MTFNNSVMVKGKKETWLDPYIVYLIMIIRRIEAPSGTAVYYKQK